MTPRPNAPCTLLAFSLATACGAVDDDPQVGYRRAAIVRGVADDLRRAVGLLETNIASCTATLIGRRTALTAAHCVDEGDRAVMVFADDARSSQRVEVRVVKAVLPTSFEPASASSDIAVVVLEEEPGIYPALLNVHPLEEGMDVVIAGYGITAEGAADGGLRRVTPNRIRGLEDSRLLFVGDHGGNFCSGDSGGPTFAVVRGREAIVGVHSFGLFGCGVDGWDTRVDPYVEWVVRAAAGDAVTNASLSEDAGSGGSGGSQDGGPPDESSLCRISPDASPPAPGAVLLALVVLGAASRAGTAGRRSAR